MLRNASLKSLTNVPSQFLPIKRIRLAGMKIVRTPLHLGRYKMIGHGQISDYAENVKRPAVLHTRTTWKDDGMNSLEFKVLAKKQHPLYTNITVDIGDPPMLPSLRKI
ncbi:UNVERIFIED_CONTAM: hypothetical protein K2H54_065346 [Gekko kuhli]